jgi:glycosyltransferase involved in cell wall biosynthesis
MRFSVIIPTFNRASLLRQAIDSVLSQTYSDLEIIVVDDGSTDNTREVVSSYGQQARYFGQENTGKPAALNVGIAVSCGDVINVLDDDDFLPPWALARHAEMLQKNRAAEFSYGRFVRFRGNAPPPLSELQDMELVPKRDPRRLVVKLMENCFLPNPSWAVRRSAQLKTGPYDEGLRYSEDYDMILRLARTNEGVLINDVVLFQRKHFANRGPISERAYMLDAIDKWVKYDARIFEKINRQWAVTDFRPFVDEPPHACGDAIALLQKGIILFQRKVYDGAAHALVQYRDHLEARSPTRTELRIATGLLGCRYGLTELISDRPASGMAMGWLRSGSWPMLMRIALASQLRWRVRAALSEADVDYAVKLVRFSREAFGMAATAAVLGSRYSAGRRHWTDAG